MLPENLEGFLSGWHYVAVVIPDHVGTQAATGLGTRQFVSPEVDSFEVVAGLIRHPPLGGQVMDSDRERAASRLAGTVVARPVRAGWVVRSRHSGSEDPLLLRQSGASRYRI